MYRVKIGGKHEKNCYDYITNFLISGCSENEADKSNTLIVLTNSGVPPYEMTDKDGVIYGFDIDVMNKIAEYLNYDVVWKDMPLDGLIESIKLNEGDLAISGLTPTPERAEQVDFSIPYYEGEDMENYVLILKNNSDISNIQNFRGKTIGVQLGSTQEAIATDMSYDYEIDIEKRASYTDLLTELNANKIDFILIEKASAIEIARGNNDLTYFKLEDESENNGVAIAMKKDSPLLKEINQVIEVMKETGELEKIREKWFE